MSRNGKRSFLVRYDVAPPKLVVNKKVNCPESVASERCLRISKHRVRFRSRQGKRVGKDEYIQWDRDRIGGL